MKTSCCRQKPHRSCIMNMRLKMPIIDYHCHLIPQMVADDYQFKSLTEIWLGGDHYKWRAMRTNGVDERYVPVKTPRTGKI